MEKLETEINKIFDKHILEEIDVNFIYNKIQVSIPDIWRLMLRVYMGRFDIEMKMYLLDDGEKSTLLDTEQVLKAYREGGSIYHPKTGSVIDIEAEIYICFVKYPVLHLNLIKVWFDMIKKGDKKEEYRDITEYWGRRFVNGKIKIKGVCYHPSDVIVCFSNGYAKNRDQFYVQIKGMKVGKGKPEWGAQLNQQYHVLQLK